jgi:hypothetical protein
MAVDAAQFQVDQIRRVVEAMGWRVDVVDTSKDSIMVQISKAKVPIITG